MAPPAQRLADGALRHLKGKPGKSKVVSLLVETVVAINSEPVEICFVCEHSWLSVSEQVNQIQVYTAAHRAWVRSEQGTQDVLPVRNVELLC